ncbi:alpha/beta-hydrolase [Cyathus striatus]|nr:alpha/beta-hydrolase [Cyathus striatus]
MLTPLLPVLLLAQGVFAAPRLTSPLGPVVDLGYAAFAGNSTTPTGVRNGPVTFFGGIPYAEPPLGALRFRAPKTLDESKITHTVTDARNWGSFCIQTPATAGVGGEDCLNLNVWKPTNATEKSKLPVVVYFHGGGFTAGTPRGSPLYDWVVQHPGGIVGVSVTYRLNFFGFLGGSVVAADGDLNAGLLDQRAGLEWVQRHIAKFGGDPDNVTIDGESAGGASVVMQVVAYGGSRSVPFKRAIAQSIGYGPMRPPAQADAFFKNVTSALGCSGNLMACVRNGTTAQFIDIINTNPNGAFSPQAEGPTGFLPQYPSRLIAEGKFNNVEFIGGHCTGDGKTFAVGTPDQFVTDDDIRRLVFSRWPSVVSTNATIDEALQVYPAPDVPGSPFQTQWDRAWTMAGEIVYTCMDWFLAEQLKAKRQNNIFAFSWDAPNPIAFNANPYLGAMHGSDVYFLFDGTFSADIVPTSGATFIPFNSSEAALSKEAIAYWTSFIATGNPSTTKLSNSLTWAGYFTDGQPQRLLFDRGGDIKTNSTIQTVTDAEITRCKFWMTREDVTAETRV